MLIAVNAQGQPRPGKRPVSVGRGPRHAKRVGRFFDRQAREIMQLDKLCGVGIFDSQLSQRFVYRQQLVWRIDSSGLSVGQFDPLKPTAMSDSALAPGIFDEDAPHRLGSGGKEVASIGELLIAKQSQIDLVNQGRGVEGLARLFMSHFRLCESAKLIVDQRQQLIGSLPIASFNGI
jgi:hypothetical protein